MSKLRDKYVAAGKVVESGKIDLSRSGIPPAPRIKFQSAGSGVTPAVSRNKRGGVGKFLVFFVVMVFGFVGWHYRESIELFDVPDGGSDQSGAQIGANLALNAPQDDSDVADSRSSHEVPSRVIASSMAQANQGEPTSAGSQTQGGSGRIVGMGEPPHSEAPGEGGVEPSGSSDLASSGVGYAASLQVAADASLKSGGARNATELTNPRSGDQTGVAPESVSSAQLVRRFIAERQGPSGCGDFPEVYCESDAWNQAARYALQVGSGCDVGGSRNETCPIDAESVIDRKVHEIEITVLQRKQEMLERQLSDVRFSAPSSYSLEMEPCKEEAIRSGLSGDAYQQYVTSTCLSEARAARANPLRELLGRVIVKIGQLRQSNG